MADQAAAHVPLPEITMSNSVRRTIFTLKINGNTTSEPWPRSSVGAGYRCVVLASQTGNRRKNRLFLLAFRHACGQGPARPSASRKTLTRPTYGVKSPKIKAPGVFVPEAFEIKAFLQT
jgi:hypothetical protein